MNERDGIVATKEVHDDSMAYSIIMHAKEAWADFQVYEIVGGYAEGERLYCLKGSNDIHDGMTKDIAQAQVFMRGFIKWDECFQATLSDPHLHFDGRSGLECFGKLFTTIYAMAEEIMPGFQGSTA